jgi:pimeloyl-ACP methyl ester carboxylesterase
MQRPIRLCTLDYYLKFVRAAVESLPQKPILMGHSMGGALTQWYMRDVGNLPAAVLVGAWALYRGFWACGEAFRRLDMPGCILSTFKVRAEFVRTPQRAARALLSDDSVISPEEIYAKLVPESVLVMLQHLRPWRVPARMTTPILWLGAEKDTLIPEFAARRAASVYPTADYSMVAGAAHNLMMEHNYREIAQEIDGWLALKLSPTA